MTRGASNVPTCDARPLQSIDEQMADLLRQRDELLHALRLMVGIYDGVRDAVGPSVRAKLAAADAAISGVRGRIG